MKVYHTVLSSMCIMHNQKQKGLSIMLDRPAFTLLRSVLFDVEKLQLLYFENWDDDISQIDLHLRAQMKDSHALYDTLRAKIKGLAFVEVLTIHDPFLLNYTFFRASPSHHDFYAIGPYRSLIYDEQDYAALSQKNHLTTAQIEELRILLQDIPCTITRDSALAIAKNILTQFCAVDTPTVQEINLEHAVQNESFALPLQDINEHARWIEEVYKHQHMLSLYVSQGDFPHAIAESHFFPKANLQRGSLDSRTSHRSYLYAANTTFRLVAQQVGVHPVYLDDISNLYVQKLANCISHKQLDKVYYDMIKAYCNLCREYPNRRYSQNMQKVINYILLNLSDELSPQSIAAAVNFSPGYISHKFKEETGLTLMGYITQQRIRLAKKMLTDTDMSIRDIAIYVGIPDSNYFTKIFKKETNTTPNAYRKEVSIG